tara:strand:- start:760 stop:1002 length:243 start_codon:yes stop_codon:yes gene_type:complete
MKSFIEYLNEAMKKPNIVQGVFSPRARKARGVYDKRHSDWRKSEVKWRKAEADLKRDMKKLRGGGKDINTPWTTSTNAAT